MRCVCAEVALTWAISLCYCDASVKAGAYEMGGGRGKQNKKTRTRKRGVLARGPRMRLVNLKF